MAVGKSQGMLIATDQDGKPILTELHSDIKPGTVIH